VHAVVGFNRVLKDPAEKVTSQAGQNPCRQPIRAQSKG
jgi:hypothetical protein